MVTDYVTASHDQKMFHKKYGLHTRLVYHVFHFELLTENCLERHCCALEISCLNTITKVHYSFFFPLVQKLRL